MTERARMVLAGWLRSWKVWIALLVLAVDVLIQALAPAGDLLIPLAQYAATTMLVANTRGLLHGHVLLPGRSLVPGTRRDHSILAAITVALLLVPTAVISVLRAPTPFVQLTMPLGLLAGFAIASVRTPSLRGALIGATGGSMGPLAAWLDDAGPDSVVAGFFADPGRMAIGGAVAVILVAALAMYALRRDETPNAFRGASGRSDEGCDSDSESNWLASTMPVLRKRLPLRRTRAGLPTRDEASAIWRRSGDPLHPVGLGMFMGALYALITLGDLVDEGAFDVMASGTLHLFVLLGCAPLAIGYARRRFRVEAMRPVTRDDMFRAFARAFAIDLAQYAVGVLVLILALHAAFDAFALAQPAYWIRLLPLPGMLAVGAAATCIATRWTRYGGFGGFILAGVFYAVVVGSFGDDAAGTAAGVMTVVGFVLAAALIVVARAVWRDFEPGRG